MKVVQNFKKITEHSDGLTVITVGETHTVTLPLKHFSFITK